MDDCKSCAVEAQHLARFGVGQVVARGSVDFEIGLIERAGVALYVSIVGYRSEAELPRESVAMSDEIIVPVLDQESLIEVVGVEPSTTGIQRMRGAGHLHRA